MRRRCARSMPAALGAANMFCSHRPPLPLMASLHWLNEVKPQFVPASSYCAHQEYRSGCWAAAGAAEKATAAPAVARARNSVRIVLVSVDSPQPTNPDLRPRIHDLPDGLPCRDIREGLPCSHIG